MSKLLFFFTLSLISFTSYSQSTASNILYESEIIRRAYETGVTADELWEIRKKEVAESYEAITLLNGGTMIFLLDFKKKEYEYYLKFNNEKAASKLKKKQAKINKSIMLAMDSLFTFCSVVYISTDDVMNVIEEKFDQLTFYNQNFKTYKNKNIKKDSFLIGQFGNVEQDEAVYSHNDSINKNYGGNKMSLSALVIRKSNMVQLRKPFPYYQKYFAFGIVKKRYNRPARTLNTEMKRFLGRGEPTFVRREKRLKEINAE